MKKIGFIDYYLDEWHANHYPKMIKELSGGAAEVSYAWAEKDAENGMSNARWAQENDIVLAGTQDELIEKSDYLVVLSPDNPEMHEELCRKALKSGKRTFVDKTFAPSKEMAARLFELADKNNTPMYSCSALRFCKELAGVDKNGVDFISSRGPGSFEPYLIHQVEPIISVMGFDLKRIMFVGTNKIPGLLMEYRDGRKAVLNMFGWDCPFSLALGYNSDKTVVINECTDYFESFLKNMIRFFLTGEGRIEAAETIAIMDVIEKSRIAAQKPLTWVELC